MHIDGFRDGVAPRRSKYFIFALYLPLFQLILDVFILNTQELVFGWKVYDYVSYQRYRFSVRDQRCVARRPVVWRRRHAIVMNRLRERWTRVAFRWSERPTAAAPRRWMMNSKVLDESIAESLQTLDLMCFSEQYYFLVALISFGMLLVLTQRLMLFNFST